MVSYMLIGVVLATLCSFVRCEGQICFDGDGFQFQYCEHGCCGSNNRSCCPNVGAIIGIVIGVLGAIAIVVIIIVCCRQHSRRQQQLRSPPMVMMNSPGQPQVVMTTAAYPAYGQPQPMGAYPAAQPMGAYPGAQPMGAYPGTQPMGAYPATQPPSAGMDETKAPGQPPAYSN